MAKGKRKLARLTHRSSQREPSTQGFYTPFEGLDQHLDRSKREVSRHFVSNRGKSRPAAPGKPNEDEKLFLDAMAGVIPLRNDGRERIPPPPPTATPPRFLVQEEMEAYAHLVDLVAGEGPFELSYSDEFVDGAVIGLSPDILRKLRRGDFSYQEYLDLHGYTRQQARELVQNFVKYSFAENYRCILIVSGRGLNSKDREPVLKHSLVVWLTHAPLKQFVLAFASARSYDGGAGAFYVLLRKNKGKASVVSPAG